MIDTYLAEAVAGVHTDLQSDAITIGCTLAGIVAIAARLGADIQPGALKTEPWAAHLSATAAPISELLASVGLTARVATSTDPILSGLVARTMPIIVPHDEHGAAALVAARTIAIDLGLELAFSSIEEADQ